MRCLRLGPVEIVMFMVLSDRIDVLKVCSGRFDVLKVWTDRKGHAISKDRKYCFVLVKDL